MTDEARARVPLVLLPGLLCDHALWEAQVAGLADVADPAVTDLTRDDSMDAMAERVLAETGATRFALAGLSMGGYLAFEIMRRAPHRVTRLALLDTSHLRDTPEARERRLALMAQARSGNFKGVTKRLLALFIHPDRMADAELCERVMAMAARVGIDAFLRQQKAILERMDSTRDLGRIQCPTLVLCGRQDALTPLAVHEEMAAAIPNGRLVVIENSGHLPTMERPDAVTAALRTWLIEED